MWHTHPNFWRGRYDPDLDAMVFEWIAESNLGADNWAENENARISCVGFDAGAIDADFTVRGIENGVPVTIHYSDGIDTWIAESDEASLTGWAWENLTKVFDGTSPDSYKRVNLCADRRTPNPKLNATAVFTDDSESTQYVVCKIQTTGLDITGWGASIDISDNTNENMIYGESCRSVGASGAEADDILFVYKEGDALKSQYMSSGVVRGIQTVDATAYSGKSAFDLEHSIIDDEKICHVIFMDADGTIKSMSRASGNTTAWGDLNTLDDETIGHLGVGIVEQGEGGLLYFIWSTQPNINYRIHRHSTDTWVPALANPADEFDPSTDAVVDTDTVFQLQTTDYAHPYSPILMNWIGLIDEDKCAIGWGLLIDAATKIYTREAIATLPTDDDNLDIFFIDEEYTDVETDNDVYVDMSTDVANWVFEFKDKNNNNTDKIKISWKGKTDLAPSSSTVYLQIYNQVDEQWETIASDGATGADTEFTLAGSQFAEVDKYYESSGSYYWASCRVYQVQI